MAATNARDDRTSRRSTSMVGSIYSRHTALRPYIHPKQAEKRVAAATKLIGRSIAQLFLNQHDVGTQQGEGQNFVKDETDRGLVA